MIKIHANFLKYTFNEKYNLIVINPPWKIFGVKFIAKSVDLLTDGGQLVCIMDYNKFTRNKNQGSFYDLLQKGYFKYIRNDSSRNKDGPFPGIGDSIAFVWVKNKSGTTTIKNRTGKIFRMDIPKNNKYPPQIPNEKDFFDWEGIKISATGASQDFKEPSVVFANRPSVDKIKYDIFSKKSEKNFSGAFVPLRLLNEEVFRKFIEENNQIFWENYCVSHGWMRFPPFRRDLDFWKNKKAEIW